MPPVRGTLQNRCRNHTTSGVCHPQPSAALGTNRSSSLLAQGRLAAQRVLADRDLFLLDVDAQQEWERINSLPARSLPGLERLLERP